MRVIHKQIGGPPTSGKSPYGTALPVKVIARTDGLSGVAIDTMVNNAL